MILKIRHDFIAFIKRLTTFLFGFIPPHRKAGIGERLLYGILATGDLLVLFLSTKFTPNPSGFGTHTDYGLGKCTMIRLYNTPCPFCGMTTCFANMGHVRPLVAIQTHPFGFIFFLVFAVALPVLAFGIIRGYKVHHLLVTERFSLFLDLMFALLALSYSYKIIMFITIFPRP